MTPLNSAVLFHADAPIDPIGASPSAAPRRHLAQRASEAVPGDPDVVVLRMGARFTTAFRTAGDQLIASRVINHGPLRLAAAHAAAANANGVAATRMVRAAARQVVERIRLDGFTDRSRTVVAATGIARAVIELGAHGRNSATVHQVHAATEWLGDAWAARRSGGGSGEWIEPLMIGSALLGALLDRLGATGIEAELAEPA